MSLDFRKKASEYTQARIALAYSGGSISTKDLLKFRFDHAEAKDAVLTECDWSEIQSSLNGSLILLHSKANSRSEYLLRPDLGRVLSHDSNKVLDSYVGKKFDISIAVADGLSSLAVQKNFIPFFKELNRTFENSHYAISPVFGVSLGRVASGDEIGEKLNTKVHIQIIGERPGLSSADSLGIYITYQPKKFTTDERRNCISNVRPEGYSFSLAAEKTFYLVEQMMLQKVSGVHLKDRLVELPDSKNFLES